MSDGTATTTWYTYFFASLWESPPPPADEKIIAALPPEDPSAVIVATPPLATAVPDVLLHPARNIPVSCGVREYVAKSAPSTILVVDKKQVTAALASLRKTITRETLTCFPIRNPVLAEYMNAVQSLQSTGRLSICT